MEERLKERLTGAILLVVVVVILVPAIFRGEQPGAAGTTAAPAAQQVYTIDLQGAPAPASGAETAVGESAAAPEAVAPAGEPASAEARSANSAGEGAPGAPPGSITRAGAVPAPELKAPVAAPPTAAAAAPVRPATPARAAAAPRPAGKSAPAARSASTVGAKGAFIVQVGSFNKRENAQQMVKQAARKGLRLLVAGPDDHGNFRVRTAPVHTRQEAEALQERLRGQGFKGLIGAVN